MKPKSHSQAFLQHSRTNGGNKFEVQPASIQPLAPARVLDRCSGVATVGTGGLPPAGVVPTRGLDKNCFKLYTVPP